MTDAQDATQGLTDDQLDQLVVTEFPYPIAVNYQRLLDTEGWERRTRRCFEVFEFGMRAVTLGVLSQYCFRDRDEVNDPGLDEELAKSLARAPLGKWVHFLFLSLQAYRGRRELFFMPELYEMYWDISREPHRKRKRVRDPFDRLVNLRNKIVHYKKLPANEEEWQAVGQEALADLRAVLRRFSFLKEYDLIRIVGAAGDEYEYERYTGQAVTGHQGGLRGVAKSLRANWFYLCRQDCTVLTLHPLLIFWFEELEQEGEKEQDAAVFSGLLTEAVEYVATVARESIRESDPELVDQLWAMLECLKDRISKPRQRVKLSWPGLRQVSQVLTAGHMGATRDKYRRDLYMQRLEILSEFQEFLESEKVCFVLTGKSGVGKSNFILSLADEYADQEDVAFLMYNGARLEIPKTIVEMLSEDLSGYLELGGTRPADLWAAIDLRAEMEQKKLVVVFDAINENADGKTLLRQIDQLVGQVRYPWLKVIITSRPQAWRTMKRGAHLAEDRYYRRRGSEDHWVELEGFTVQIDPFKRAELPDVYGKYQQVFHLQTKYEALNAAIREDLKDPLMLRLVAEIYKEQAIPKRVQLSDIYGEYVRALLVAERLYEEDIILLEQELIPRMLSLGYYENKVTASQVHEAITRDGRPLWELILNDDLLESGQRVNDSYVRLVDADILTVQGALPEYEITFEYERFYDYYGGKRLFGLAKRHQSIETYYQNLITKTQTSSYLWGPVKNALVLELKANNRDLIMALVGVQDATMEEILIAALGEYGHDAPELASEILLTLLATKSRFVRLWEHASSLLPWRQRVLTESPQRHRIAVKAAFRANLWSILNLAALKASTGTRMVAIESIFYLWRDGKREQVLDILRKLRGRMLIGPIPRMSVLSSCAAISILILFAEYPNREALQPLQAYWQEILDTLLLNRPGQSTLLVSAVRSIRGTLVDAVSSLGIGLARTLEKTGATFGVSDLDSFFTAGDGRRQKFAALIPYLDCQAHDLEEAKPLLYDLAASRDLLTSYLLLSVLDFNLLQDEERTVAIMREMLRESMAISPPGVQILPLLISGSFYKNARGSESDRAVQKFHKEALKLFNEKAGCRFRSDRGKYVLAHLGAVVAFDDYLDKRVDDKYIREFARPALEKGDLELLKAAIDSIAGQAVRRGQPRRYLKALDLFLHLDSEDLEPFVAAAFSRIRAYNQYAVDDFLEEVEASDDLKRKVRASILVESMGELIISYGLGFLEKVFLVPGDPLLPQFAWWLEEATRMPSFGRWLGALIKAIVNLIYGAPIFDIGQGRVEQPSLK